jgi:outer membrane putative beta-barrel porin/alpha-amylase
VNKLALLLSPAVVAAVLSSSAARAQVANSQSDARDYEALTNLPNGSVAALGYFRDVSSSDSTDFSEAQAAFRGSYVLRFGNLALVPFDAILPVVNLSVFEPAPAPAVGSTTLHASGLGDATYLPTIGYSVSEDDLTHTHTYVAFTPYITGPTGTYDSTKLVNLGDHRWRVQPQIVVGQRFLKALTAEVVGNFVWYGDNDEFLVPGLGTTTLKQDLTAGMEVHLAADLSPTFYLAASYYLAAVGKRTVDTPAGAVTADDSQMIQTLRFSYGIRIEKGTNVLLQYNQDVAASGGASITRFFGVRVAHVFF